jgi:hypothetical protein
VARGGEAGHGRAGEDEEQVAAAGDGGGAMGEGGALRVAIVAEDDAGARRQGFEDGPELVA